MPEMAGRETNLRLRNINPDVRVLLSSGYSQNGIATEILNEGAMGFVQKPFKIQELSKVINDILKK
jgi:FixJ family two-component response regulator